MLANKFHVGNPAQCLGILGNPRDSMVGEPYGTQGHGMGNSGPIGGPHLGTQMNHDQVIIHRYFTKKS